MCRGCLFLRLLACMRWLQFTELCTCICVYVWTRIVQACAVLPRECNVLNRYCGTAHFHLCMHILHFNLSLVQPAAPTHARHAIDIDARTPRTFTQFPNVVHGTKGKGNTANHRFLLNGVSTCSNKRSFYQLAKCHLSDMLTRC